MNAFTRIIFLDEDNTMLSPLASALFQKKMEVAGISDKYSVTSRGNVVLIPEPVNPKMLEVGHDFKVYMDHFVTKQLDEEEFAPTTLIIAMDKDCKDTMYSKYQSAQNVYTLKEFIGSEGDVKLPIGGTLEEYTVVGNMLDGFLDSLLKKLEEEE